VRVCLRQSVASPFIFSVTPSGALSSSATGVVEQPVGTTSVSTRIAQRAHTLLAPSVQIRNSAAIVRRGSLIMLLSPLGERLGEGVMQETVFVLSPSPNLSRKGGEEHDLQSAAARCSIAATAGRLAFRNVLMCRTASGIFSGTSFHGYMLTCELGASIATSIATA
jgi:hypothetical protein